MSARGSGRGGAGRGRDGRRPTRGTRPSPPPPAGGERESRAGGGRERPAEPALASRLLYGRNPVHEALRARRRPVRRVWATASAAREPWLSGVPVTVVEAGEIAERAQTDAHQGVCADVAPYPYADAGPMLAAEAPLIVALDEVQDPQNLGAIARTAECAGATGLVLPRHRSAEVTPAACKASAGAVEHLPIARVRNVSDFLVEAKDAGCWIYGAAADGVAYTKPDYAGGVVLVLGAEGRGLRPRVRKQCDQLVALPLRGQMESLNVSAAAAALLYGIVARRG
ncbi:MAG TPA: 23S rRNA (guanosine(2251)-2'-O)-methyltransferase RlmB [Baekduia sp.]|nr:23S rRNA (guanosine(2251)-2'-O)-methyltransferase RlmB [Baekduia sp.]